MQLEKELMDHTCVLNFNACYFFPLFGRINHISAAMIDGCQRKAIRLMDLRGLVLFQNLKYQYERGSRMELEPDIRLFTSWSNGSERSSILHLRQLSFGPCCCMRNNFAAATATKAAVKCDISLGWLRNGVPGSLSDSLNWAISLLHFESSLLRI